MKAYKITSGGQISLPVAVRRRWGASRVMLEDHGDSVTVRPVPDDPIAAFRGSFAGRSGPSTEEFRSRLRSEEGRAESRRLAGR